MFKTLKNALKVKDIRTRLLFTFLMLIVVRFGSQLPVPGTNPEALSQILGGMKGNDAFSFMDALTGGSFETFSLMALSITPYITSSIIMQLMTLAIPALEEMQKDGEEGRRKISEYTRYVTVGLALIESTAMAISFGSKGLMDNYTWYNIIEVILALTAGSAFLMWIGEQITEHGVGNGISVVLLINILSRAPQDATMLYERFISGKEPAKMILTGILVCVVVVLVVVLTVLLYGATRKIPVQYAKRVQGRKMLGGQNSFIPLKINTAGVIPVIFASSLMSIPNLIVLFLKDRISYEGTIGQIFYGVLGALSSTNWFHFTKSTWYFTFGYVLFVGLVVAFAYFYTSITFNPMEIANNMKKQGGFIPGIRPGKPTSDYLNKILNYVVFEGAVGLTLVVTIPYVVQGVFQTGHISCGGTSLIIIVGVVIETLNQIESKMLVRNYRGFLNN